MLATESLNLNRIILSDFFVTMCNQPMSGVIRRKPDINLIPNDNFNIKSFHFTTKLSLNVDPVSQGDMVHATAG